MLNYLPDLGVAGVCVLEIEAVPDVNHDIFGVRFGVGCFLGIVDEVSGHLWGIVSLMFRISLYETLVTGEERIDQLFVLFHPRIEDGAQDSSSVAK